MTEKPTYINKHIFSAHQGDCLANQCEYIEKYYRLYEYTDDICVLEDNPLYPGLFNYVKTGLLTKEELIDALEYDKDLEQ